jgi:glycosyltransferase involved in cell wall biosynthesis
MRTPQSPPIIIPVIESIDQPFWSIMIPAYNCSEYLPETIESVLANDFGIDNIQIEVIDDYSTDADVKKIVEDFGKGKVSYFQQKINVGSLRNFETCINRAKGKWVHILHGDDKVEKGFYEEIKQLFTTYPQIGAAFTKVRYIDDNGNVIPGDVAAPKNTGLIIDWLSQIAAGNIISTPSIVVKREVYERLGGFFAVHYGEDWEMWVRIAANYPVAYSSQPLAKYRYLRSKSISYQSWLSGQNCKDIMKVIDIIQDYLPEDNKTQLKNKAKRTYSRYFANASIRFYNEFHNAKGALYLAFLALRMDVSSKTIYTIFKIMIKVIISFLGLGEFLKNRSVINNQ